MCLYLAKWGQNTSKQAHLRRAQNVSMKNPQTTQVTIVHNQTVEMQAEHS